MAALADIVAYCDRTLTVDAFRDYAPNGLQVEGRPSVRRVVSGVTASLALVEQAIERGADAILVHHGYFWRGEDARLVGMKGQRVRRLMQADVGLLAYHLPLDAHAELGNNACLGERLGLRLEETVEAGGIPGLLARGECPEPMTPEEFGARVHSVLGREPTLAGGGPERIRSVAWCTGAAQGFIDQAADLGVDLYLSGEISEPTAHVARERGLYYCAAGHHATERYGVQALGARLAEVFDIEHEFIDVDNPA